MSMSEVSGDHLQKAVGPPPPVQPVTQTMQLSYGADGTALYKPVTGNGNGANVGLDQASKKRRGRPRKYGPDGSMPAPLNAAPPLHQVFASPPPPQQQQQLQFQQQQQVLPAQQQQQDGGPGSPPKKARGRPPGSSNRKQQQQHIDAMGALAIGFTPHVITVNAGEDISSKIMSFTQNGPRAICILSANGAVSNVTLSQAATSGGSVTYEGRFEILSLSGSFMPSEGGAPRGRTGGLSVSLAGPDGRILGGGVAGHLVALSPVQVVVGSFIADGRRELKSPNQTDSLFAPSRLNSATGPTGPSSPPSRGTLSESSGGPGSPLNHSAAAVNSTPPGMSGLPWK